jgi:hypothetical protein
MKLKIMIFSLLLFVPGGTLIAAATYGFTAVVYSSYAYELEIGGQHHNQAGRVTEVFVRRKGQWVNPGWHMDSGK